MKATAVLEKEHEAVLVMLGILEEMGRRIEAGRAVDRKDLEGMAEFLTVFVDRCHHAKEEEGLFPAAEGAGIPKEGGPIGMMLSEHEVGRGYVRKIREAITAYEAGEEGAGKKFGEGVLDYAGLLRQHIEKENNILYPTIEMYVDEKKDGELLKRFDEIEGERIGVGRHEEFHGLIENLKKKYLGETVSGTE